jgi:hypothetical protein
VFIERREAKVDCADIVHSMPRGYLGMLAESWLDARISVIERADSLGMEEYGFELRKPKWLFCTWYSSERIENEIKAAELRARGPFRIGNGEGDAAQAALEKAKNSDGMKAYRSLLNSEEWVEVCKIENAICNSYFRGRTSIELWRRELLRVSCLRFRYYLYCYDKDYEKVEVLPRSIQVTKYNYLVHDMEQNDAAKLAELLGQKIEDSEAIRAMGHLRSLIISLGLEFEVHPYDHVESILTEFSTDEVSVQNQIEQVRTYEEGRPYGDPIWLELLFQVFELMSAGVVGGAAWHLLHHSIKKIQEGNEEDRGKVDTAELDRITEGLIKLFEEKNRYITEELEVALGVGREKIYPLLKLAGVVCHVDGPYKGYWHVPDNNMEVKLGEEDRTESRTVDSESKNIPKDRTFLDKVVKSRIGKKVLGTLHKKLTSLVNEDERES